MGSEDEFGDDNECRWRDGMMAKRVKNQLITRPDIFEELALIDTLASQPPE